MSGFVRVSASVTSDNPEVVVTRAMEAFTRVGVGLALDDVEVSITAGPDDGEEADECEGDEAETAGGDE